MNSIVFSFSRRILLIFSLLVYSYSQAQWTKIEDSFFGNIKSYIQLRNEIIWTNESGTFYTTDLVNKVKVSDDFTKNPSVILNDTLYFVFLDGIYRYEGNGQSSKNVNQSFDASIHVYLEYDDYVILADNSNYYKFNGTDFQILLNRNTLLLHASDSLIFSTNLSSYVLCKNYINNSVDTIDVILPRRLVSFLSYFSLRGFTIFPYSDKIIVSSNVFVNDSRSNLRVVSINKSGVIKDTTYAISYPNNYNEFIENGNSIFSFKSKTFHKKHYPYYRYFHNDRLDYFGWVKADEVNHVVDIIDSSNLYTDYMFNELYDKIDDKYIGFAKYKNKGLQVISIEGKNVSQLTDFNSGNYGLYDVFNFNAVDLYKKINNSIVFIGFDKEIGYTISSTDGSKQGTGLIGKVPVSMYDTISVTLFHLGEKPLVYCNYILKGNSYQEAYLFDDNLSFVDRNNLIHKCKNCFNTGFEYLGNDIEYGARLIPSFDYNDVNNHKLIGSHSIQPFYNNTTGISNFNTNFHSGKSIIDGQKVYSILDDKDSILLNLKVSSSNSDAILSNNNDIVIFTTLYDSLKINDSIIITNRKYSYVPLYLIRYNYQVNEVIESILLDSALSFLDLWIERIQMDKLVLSYYDGISSRKLLLYDGGEFYEIENSNSIIKKEYVIHDNDYLYYLKAYNEEDNEVWHLIKYSLQNRKIESVKDISSLFVNSKPINICFSNDYLLINSFSINDSTVCTNDSTTLYFFNSNFNIIDTVYLEGLLLHDIKKLGNEFLCFYESCDSIGVIKLNLLGHVTSYSYSEKFSSNYLSKIILEVDLINENYYIYAEMSNSSFIDDYYYLMPSTILRKSLSLMRRPLTLISKGDYFYELNKKIVNGNSFLIYPNPLSHGNFLIINSINSNIKVKELHFLDYKGSVISIYNLRDKSLPNRISLPFVRNGVYFLRLVMEDDKVETHKLVLY